MVRKVKKKVRQAKSSRQTSKTYCKRKLDTKRRGSNNMTLLASALSWLLGEKQKAKIGL
jgi:hypothetical protein